jgi:hypothetical protein
VGLIAGTRHFILQVIGEVPPGVTDAEITQAVTQAVAIAVPIVPLVKTVGMAVQEGAPPTSPKLQT